MRNKKSLCTLEGTDTRASGIGGLFSSSAEMSGFLSLNSILKELYCVSKAPLDILNVEI